MSTPDTVRTTVDILNRRLVEQSDRAREAERALAEVSAERDRLRDAALMYSAMVADRNAERDRLLVALRSAHCALYEGGSPSMALDIIDGALNSQQDGEGHG